MKRRLLIGILGGVVLAVIIGLAMSRYRPTAKIQQLSPDELAERQKHYGQSERGRIYGEVLVGKPGEQGAPAMEEFGMRTVAFVPPAGYALKTHDEQHARFVAGDGGTRVLAVVLQPASTIDDIPAVQARRLKPAVYHESVQVVGGKRVIVFTKETDGQFEWVLFGSDTTTVTSVAISSLTLAGSEKARADWEMILPTIRWR